MIFTIWPSQEKVAAPGQGDGKNLDSTPSLIKFHVIRGNNRMVLWSIINNICTCARVHTPTHQGGRDAHS